MNSSGQFSTLQRPIQRIYPLEVNGDIGEITTGDQQPPTDKSQVQQSPTAESVPADVQPSKTTRRPVRAAAKMAAERFKQWSAQILEKNAIDSYSSQLGGGHVELTLHYYGHCTLNYMYCALRIMYDVITCCMRLVIYQFLS